MQAQFLVAAMVALGLAGVSGWAEQRRLARVHPDRVGVVPWTGVQLAAIGATVILTALALSDVAR